MLSGLHAGSAQSSPRPSPQVAKSQKVKGPFEPRKKQGKKRAVRRGLRKLKAKESKRETQRELQLLEKKRRPYAPTRAFSHPRSLAPGIRLREAIGRRFLFSSVFSLMGGGGNVFRTLT